MEIVQWGREAKGIDTSRNYTLPEYVTCIGIIADRGGDSAIMVDCLSKNRKDRAYSTNSQWIDFNSAGRRVLMFAH